jgi:signal transduction histidine kinase/DNA-binding response OmpR family regulator
VRLFSLRRILAFSLVLMALVPAVLVAWLMARASSRAVDEMAARLLTQVAERVQLSTEDHLRQAHNALNGLISVRLTASEAERARGWLRQPASFEAMAFALTRQSPDVPALYLGNARGDYFAVETSSDGVKIARHSPGDMGRHFYLARQPGDRGQPLPSESDGFDPRMSPWYDAAVRGKDRVFSPVQVSVERQQLMVRLSQPVYDAQGDVAGVFGADLYLKQLADVLRTQRISSHGAAFIVDEQGGLVASSAGDALYVIRRGMAMRRSPRDSANAMIRAGFSVLESLWARQREDTVASNTALQRRVSEDGTLLMVQRPFGQALGLRWTLVVAAPESDFTAGIAEARQTSFGVIAVLVSLGALIAWLIAQGIGRRLSGLSQAARQLGSGEVPVIDQTTRIQEVRQLSEVLHDSAGQLQGYRAQVKANALALQQANETLEVRVAERTSELLASREEALAAARAKAAFLATMSHEIRTPLNGVVGMGTLLAETPLNAEQRDYLQTIRLSSDQLLAVINDILDFSKIESGKLELEAEPLSLRSAVEEACDIAAPRAREKGLEVIIDVPDSSDGRFPVALLGDVTRLRQVLINLINNAVKFTAHGEVAVHARQVGPVDGDGRVVVEFRVTDSGIGIPASRIPSLFEAFTQVDASTTRKYGGTGLGLAICQRLVGLMGGQLGVESEVGRGSTFWFTVVAPVAELPPSGGVSGASVLKASRALIVDDHATNVRILKRQLEIWGMEVVTADSGAAALQWLTQQTPGGNEAADVTGARPRWLPDIVITDMHMPEMDGVTLAHTLKSRPEWRDIPLVLLSSGFMPSGDENARLFDARLLKPARQAQLCDTLARCISSDHALDGVADGVAVEQKKHAAILVADDNAVNLKVASAMLRKLGYDFETAVDGREAVAAVARSVAHGAPFAAILMDVNMPDVDGLEATRQILSAWGAKAPPVIALTAAAMPEDHARCEAAGMVDYLTKPLHVSALALTLEKWVVSGLASEAAAAAGADTGDSQSLTPMSEEDAAQSLVNFSRLEEFREFDDEALSMTREVVELFLADAPHRLDAIGSAIASGDASALSVAAHALKGAAGNIGATALQSMCDRLEEASRDTVPQDAEARLAALRALWARTCVVLQDWC